jgi:hypothetical protein
MGIKYESEYKGQGPLMEGEKEQGPNIRTKLERTTQVIKLCKKLKEVAELPDHLSGIKEFRDQGNIFIETGKYWEGRIRVDPQQLPGMSMNVLFSPKKSVECSITIKNHKIGRQYNKDKKSH